MNRHLIGPLVALAVIGMISWGCSQQPAQEEETRGAGDVLKDASITAAVKLALAFERGVKAVEIDIDTDRGTVTLRGDVGTEAERQLAAKVAEDVEGVKGVVNLIEVRG